MELKLNKETRDELYQLVPFSNSARIDVTPEIFEDFPDEYKPAFTIRMLTKCECEELQTIQKKANEKKLVDFAKKIIYGWSNYRQIKSISSDEIEFGETYKFTPDQNGNPTDDCFVNITRGMCGNLVGEAYRASILSDMDKAGLQ